MGHYARVEKNQVVNVIKADEEALKSIKIPPHAKWIKTSYNTNGGVYYDPKTGERSSDQSKALRKNFAGVGYIYDEAKDAFIPPQPYPSWTLDDQTCLWNAPVEMPNDGLPHRWDEVSKTWKEANPT